MYSYELKIPKERVAILIGKKGDIKKRIEKLTDTKINISATGDIFIEGEDNLTLLIVQNIVKAIGRGFSPDTALTLLEEDNTMEIINTQDFTGKSKNKFFRLKARVIGENGRARKMLEQLTNTEISIYGKTIAIIGKLEDVNLAKRAIEKLLQGSSHGNTYQFIEAQKRFKKRFE